MKKKILVPVMALAMVVTAGVNYKMLSDSLQTSNTSLSMLVKTAFAVPESPYNCDNCGDFGCEECMIPEKCNYCNGVGCDVCEDSGDCSYCDGMGCRRCDGTNDKLTLVPSTSRCPYCEQVHSYTYCGDTTSGSCETSKLDQGC